MSKVHYTLWLKVPVDAEGLVRDYGDNVAARQLLAQFRTLRHQLVNELNEEVDSYSHTYVQTFFADGVSSARTYGNLDVVFRMDVWTGPGESLGQLESFLHKPACAALESVAERLTVRNVPVRVMSYRPEQVSFVSGPMHYMFYEPVA